MHIELNESLTGGLHGVFASVIDTPGVRQFMLHDISADNLALYYPDFVPYLGKCAFGMSCSHLSEAGCAIKDAVAEGKINADRYESWLRISEEMRTGSWED